MNLIISAWREKGERERTIASFKFVFVSGTEENCMQINTNTRYTEGCKNTKITQFDAALLKRVSLQ